VRTQKESKDVADSLRKRKFKAKSYHAGLPDSVRQETHKQWLEEKIQIIVATTAFGMGKIIAKN